MWRTKNLKLTADQKSRGVIYSSQLIVLGNVGVDNNISKISFSIHEVLDSDPDKWQKIENLRDTSFFKNFAKDLEWDVIHEVRK